MYYVVQPSTLERATQVQAALNTDPALQMRKPAMSMYDTLPLFANKYKSLSYLQDIVLSKVNI